MSKTAAKIHLMRMRLCRAPDSVDAAARAEISAGPGGGKQALDVYYHRTNPNLLRTFRYQGVNALLALARAEAGVAARQLFGATDSEADHVDEVSSSRLVA